MTDLAKYKNEKFYVGHLFQVQIEQPFSFDSVSSSRQQSQLAAGRAAAFCSVRRGKPLLLLAERWPAPSAAAVPRSFMSRAIRQRPEFSEECCWATSHARRPY